MKDYLVPLLFFQRFFLPSLLTLLGWAIWRTVWRRDMAVGLALYLSLVIIVDVFMNTGIYIPGLEKGSLKYSEACAVILFFNRPQFSARRSIYGIVCGLVGVYFLLLLVAAFRSTPVLGAVTEFRMRIVPQIVAFVIAMRGVDQKQDARRFMHCMMILSLILSIFVFWDLFFDRALLHSDMLSKPEYYTNRKHGRFGSFFLNPNYLGAFTVLLFPSVFVTTISEKVKSARLLGVAAMLALAFCLVETQSRGPLLATGIVFVLLLLGPGGEMSRTRRMSIFAVFAVVFISLMPGFLEHATERFDQLDEEMSTNSGRTRETIWTYTKRAIADHPLAGIGFGEQQFVNVIMNDYRFADDYGQDSLDNPHNSYLQMTVYAGFPVLFAFLLLNGLLLFRSVRCVVGNVIAGQTQMIFGLTVGVAGFLTVIYPDMHMFTQNVAPVYWVFFALLLSATTFSEAAPIAQAYENNRSHLRNAGKHLAGQPAAVATRHRGYRDRAAPPGSDAARKNGAPPPDGEALRPGAHVQQAAVQPAPLPHPVGFRFERDPSELLPGRRTGRVLAPGADTRRDKR